MTNDNDQAFHEIVNAQQEIERLNAALMEWENREGATCPEGVPFEKVIEKLRAKLEAARKEREEVAHALLATEFVAGGKTFPPNIVAKAKFVINERSKLRSELESAKRENAQLAAMIVKIMGCEALKPDIVCAALRDLLLPTIDLLQLAISRGCWPHQEIVHKELSRLRSLCGEKGTND